MYCEDCHQIRCPRCVAEEIVTYYCPNCLFEVPSSNLKSEGNRLVFPPSVIQADSSLSLTNAPLKSSDAPAAASSARYASAPSAVTSVETKPDPSLLAAPDNTATPHSGPYALTCSYCNWTSTEVGIKLDKPNSIHAQLSKLRNGGATRLTAKERKERRKDPAYRAAAAAAAGRASRRTWTWKRSLPT